MRFPLYPGAAALSVAALLVTACASGPPDAVNPGSGLAYGAIEAAGSKLGISHVVLLRVSPTQLYMGSAGERATVTYRSGEFYAPNLAPGTYAVNGVFSGQQLIVFDKSLRANLFKVEAGRATYAGSYTLAYKAGGVFSAAQAQYTRIDVPEREQRLRAWLAKELAGTPWAAMSPR